VHRNNLGFRNTNTREDFVKSLAAVSASLSSYNRFGTSLLIWLQIVHQKNLDLVSASEGVETVLKNVLQVE